MLLKDKHQAVEQALQRRLTAVREHKNAQVNWRHKCPTSLDNSLSLLLPFFAGVAAASLMPVHKRVAVASSTILSSIKLASRATALIQRLIPDNSAPKAGG